MNLLKWKKSFSSQKKTTVGQISLCTSTHTIINALKNQHDFSHFAFKSVLLAAVNKKTGLTRSIFDDVIKLIQRCFLSVHLLRICTFCHSSRRMQSFKSRTRAKKFFGVRFLLLLFSVKQMISESSKDHVLCYSHRQPDKTADRVCTETGE